MNPTKLHTVAAAIFPGLMTVGAGDGTGVPKAMDTTLADALGNPYDIRELVTTPDDMAD